jgi:outer membrane protein assembly factor BamE (lipoprotein component of BamABCDE complex)
MANDPTYVFDSKKGGINWGYCEKAKPNKIETVSYDITVDTSKLPKSGTE